MRERRFTIEEANALVPRLEMLIERLQRSALRLAARARRDGRHARRRPGALPVERLLRERPELRAASSRSSTRRSAEIEQLGVELKDVELGLVDFPAELDGEAVLPLLAVRRGPRRASGIARSEGFAGRRPLPGVPPAPEPQ